MTLTVSSTVMRNDMEKPLHESLNLEVMCELTFPFLFHDDDDVMCVLSACESVNGIGKHF